MKGDLTIIDCDRHVLEPPDIWDRYLEPGFEHFNVQSGGAFGLTTRINGKRWGGGAPIFPDQAVADGEGFARIPEWRAAFKHAMFRGFDSRAYLDDMDREGVDVAVLFSSIGLYFCWVDDMDPELSAAMCRAYNNWLCDYCSLDPSRMKGVCLLPLQDPALALVELERASDELGMVGVFWRPNPMRGRDIAHDDYREIYALCEEKGMAVSYHEGQTTVLPQFAKNRVDTFFSRHCCSHTMEQMGAVVRIAMEGLFDRFPRLQFNFFESGSGWLPYWLERLDHLLTVAEYRDGYKGEHMPSEYFRRGQAGISCEAGEDTIALLGRAVGEDCLMWASDYPHPDCVEYFPDTSRGIVSSASIPYEFKRKILFDNPRRVFKLDVASVVAG